MMTKKARPGHLKRQHHAPAYEHQLSHLPILGPAGAEPYTDAADDDDDDDDDDDEDEGENEKRGVEDGDGDHPATEQPATRHYHMRPPLICYATTTQPSTSRRRRRPSALSTSSASDRSESPGSSSSSSSSRNSSRSRSSDSAAPLRHAARRLLPRRLRGRRGARRVAFAVLVFACIVGPLFCVWSLWAAWSERRMLDGLVGRVGAGGAGATALGLGPATPTLEGLTMVGSWAGALGPGGRLVVVGDVHGCKAELQSLLAKIAFSSSADHLVLAGDMVAKGPHSRGVVALAMSLGASCVRGNHEDRILLLRDELRAYHAFSDSEGESANVQEGRETGETRDDGTEQRAGGGEGNDDGAINEENEDDDDDDDDDDENDDEPEEDDLEQADESEVDSAASPLARRRRRRHHRHRFHAPRRDVRLARRLSDAQEAWLRACPVILRLDSLLSPLAPPGGPPSSSSSPATGGIVVAHAGLVPGTALDRQDPYSVMNMRTVDRRTGVPSKLRDGLWWAKLWNRAQAKLPARDRTTVIYGHDSRRGLRIKPYSKGVDSGCVRGGRLTGLIIEPGRGAKEELKMTVASVKCTKPKKSKKKANKDRKKKTGNGKKGNVTKD